MPVLRHPKHEAVAQALFAGQTAEQASEAAGYPTGASSFAPNARKRVQREDIQARVAELRAAFVAADEERASIALGYLLARIYEDLQYNVDDYLSPPDKHGMRYFDISRAPRNVLGRLSELAIEPSEHGTKIKVKGIDRIGLIRTAAELQGFIKSKHELTGKDGGPIEASAELSENEMLRRIAFVFHNFQAALARPSGPPSNGG